MPAFWPTCAWPRRAFVGLLAAAFVVVVAASSGAEVARSGIGAANRVAGVEVVSAVSPQAQALLAALEKRGAAKAFEQLYVGQVSGQPRLFVALGRKGNTAIAYVCDGTRVGTWFTGSAAGKKLMVKAADGSTLSGSTAPATPKFVLTRDGYPVTATLRLATGRDLFIRFRVKPPYASVGGIIGIRGVLRGLTIGTAPTGGPAPPPATSTPATGVTLSGPALTLTSTASTTLSPEARCGFLALHYDAEIEVLEAVLKINQIAATQYRTQVAALAIERAAILQKQKLGGTLTKAEAGRLIQLEAEIGALQKTISDLAASIESTKAALVSLTTSYQVERRKLGCV